MYYLEFLEKIKNKYKNHNIEKYKPLIENEKRVFIQKKDEKSLLLIWFCLSVIKAMELYHEAFLSMKNREYFKGWKELAQVEAILHNIRYNFPEYSKYITCSFLEWQINKYQQIYPYKLFMSIVFVVTEEECSICGKSMNPFNGCEHIRGKVYEGNMCQSIVKNGDLISIDFVEKPAMKCAVVFDGIDNPEKYTLLEYIIPKLPSEYIKLDYKKSKRYEPHSNFTIGKNEKCPCQSGEKYEECCMHNPRGVKYEHYHFLLPDKLLA